MSRFQAEFLDWLRLQPPGAEVKWHSWGLNAAFPWAGGWLDVAVEAFRQQRDLSWGLTIKPPGVSEPAEENGYILERDLHIYAVYDPDPPKRWFVVEIPLPQGQIPTPEQTQQLEQAVAAGPRRRRGVRGGWSAECLTQGLQAWSDHHSGRTDLCWVWDETRTLPPHITALLDAVATGLEPSYEIAPGVRASGQAFDVLLMLGFSSEPRELRKRATVDPPDFDPFSL